MRITAQRYEFSMNKCTEIPFFCYYHLFNNIGVTYFANKIEDFANKMQIPEPSEGMHKVP